MIQLIIFIKIILYNLSKKATDSRSKKENSPDPYDGSVSTIVLVNLWADFWARIVIAIVFFAFLFWNIHNLTIFIHNQSIAPTNERLNNEIISDYIKCNLGINGLIMLIVSYWFGSRSGSQNLMNNIMEEKRERYLNNK